MKEMVKMKMARLIYLLEVIVERSLVLLLVLDKIGEWRFGNPVLIHTHGFNLVLYMVLILIMVSLTFLFTKRSVLITWTLILKKEIDKHGYFQAITNEIEDRE